jgi:hypothetical protein
MTGINTVVGESLRKGYKNQFRDNRGHGCSDVQSSKRKGEVGPALEKRILQKQRTWVLKPNFFL